MMPLFEEETDIFGNRRKSAFEYYFLKKDVGMVL